MPDIIAADLLSFPKLPIGNINVIAHSCNCQKTMAAGLAKKIKDKFPNVYEVDCKKSGDDWLGKYTAAKVGKDKFVVNLYTQYTYGTDQRQVNYEAFYTALDSLVLSLSKKNTEGKNYILGLPYKISCDLAGGDWEIIGSMIDSIALKYKFDIWICKIN